MGRIRGIMTEFDETWMAWLLSEIIFIMTDARVSSWFGLVVRNHRGENGSEWVHGRAANHGGSYSPSSSSSSRSYLQDHRIRDRFILADKIYCSLLVGVVHLKMRPMTRSRRCRWREEPDRLSGTQKWDNGKVRKKKKSPFCRVVVTICWENPMQRHKESGECCFGGPTQQSGRQTGQHHLVIVLFPETESLTGVSFLVKGHF